MKKTIRHLRRRAAAAARSAVAPLVGSLVAVRGAGNCAALTFDDGPDPDRTPAVLDALARLGMRATFFMVGSHARRAPDLVARVVREGHEIGNHTWSHASLPSLSHRQAIDEIERAEEALEPASSRLFRPPYGHQTLGSWLAARRSGYHPVLWNATGGDWKGCGAVQVAERMFQTLRPGSIVLLHDSLYSYPSEAARDRAPTIGALEILAERLPGWEFVTVSELLARGRPIRTLWLARGRSGWSDHLSHVRGV
jgi:peptidoglycan-N-acetylglucosamine deacetylase